MDRTEDLYLAFVLEKQRYALRLPAVERIVRAVEITPLPKAPGIALGIVNVGGRVVPVLDIRRRFGLPFKELCLSSQFLIARTSRRTVALVVDSVTGLVGSDGERPVPAEAVVRGMEYVEGVIKRADGLVLIHDLDTFLSLEEEHALVGALRAHGKRDDSRANPPGGGPTE